MLKAYVRFSHEKEKLSKGAEKDQCPEEKGGVQGDQCFKKAKCTESRDMSRGFGGIHCRTWGIYDLQQDHRNS